ncbi:MAG: hypothetical protein O7F69_07725 [Alphaproteobacteria bacterium]|nr:hypothetical protein [Alphaproteobacteria bacterium]
MSHVSVASNVLVAQARAIGQLEEVAATDRKHKADRATSEKLRRFAMWYVMTLSTAALVATAFVFDLSGVNLGQPNAQRSAVVSAGMAGASDATATAMTIEFFGTTLSFPVRD